ncbi:MAG: WecB/TagA/CpsF family glycosyltransferase [Verrucomicrobia bacterium]|jgi:N-acetylglucosaminyldiphosphoundecaprenol N-acetyl-beta-D-mannosaminyltransferase|nr:WecB/TagA/CpsF family glycosyltransferase [Verrucomicrobiota bacterium]
MKTMYVLGAPLLVTTYDELAAQCLAWARAPRCFTLEFVNTHIVTAMRHDPAFRAIIATYDHLLPDGMPLVWCLNRAGAGLRDRVYGPTFMRRFLETAPAGTTHYLLGGSAECGARLREIFQQRNPGLRFVGAFHGWCEEDGQLEAEVRVMEELHTLAPDFIWVGFGTPKQQAWAARHKAALRRGVVLTVGFAFDANAGLKPDAPIGWQRAGLTWLFRLISEPRRLGPRYLRFNTLFLYYLLADGLRGRAWGKERPSAA